MINATFLATSQNRDCFAAHGLVAATSLFTSAAMGIPVSTTHTITGAIVGVGAVQRLSAVRWGVARQVVWAWVLTIPCSAVVAAGMYWLFAWARR
jgi:phosphate/sulfate permease